MNTLLISYDLGSPEDSAGYKQVIEYLKKYTTYAKPLYSVWLIRTEKSCSVVRDELQKITDANDEILVVSIEGDYWATARVDKEVTDWMKKFV